MTPSVESGRELPGRPGRRTGKQVQRRFVRLTAVGLTAGVALAAMVTAGGGSAGAATPISQSEGRFLTGTAAGQSFDAVAALNGEMAQYPGDPGPNQNNLSGSVLGQALNSPLSNISIPFPGGVTFGAVGQYAAANQNGSASASSGLIGSNGGINVAGSGNGNLATINLANLPGASTLTDLLGNLTLNVGAVSAQAKQAAFGKKLADPSANCTGGTYSRVSNPDQAGSYQFANLTLTVSSPAASTLLATLGSTLTTLLNTDITGLSGALPGGVVTGLPTAAGIEGTFTASVAGGGITADLADGSLTIDLAKILQSQGLDINNLCPNTSLTSYLASALGNLPGAISTLITGLGTTFASSFGNVKVGGISVPALSTLLSPFSAALTSSLATVRNAATVVNAPLQQALDVISNNLLDLTANAQNESGGAFTEAALILKLVPNGGSLPTVPGVPSFASVQSSFRRALAKATTNAKSAAKSSASASASPHSYKTAKLVSARLAAPLQAAPTGTPVLQLNLALAAVTNNAPVAATTTSTAPPSSGAAGTEVPTGVPAGAAGHNGGGSPALPIVLVLIGLVLAGGGATAYRSRGKFSH